MYPLSPSHPAAQEANSYLTPSTITTPSVNAYVARAMQVHLCASAASPFALPVMGVVCVWEEGARGGRLPTSEGSTSINKKGAGSKALH
jgi:hypothetical protein